MKPEEGSWNCQFTKVRCVGNLDLLHATGICNGGQSCGTETLTCGICTHFGELVSELLTVRENLIHPVSEILRKSFPLAYFPTYLPGFFPLLVQVLDVSLRIIP